MSTADQDDPNATRSTHASLQRLLALALPPAELGLEQRARSFLLGLRDALALTYAAVHVHAAPDSAVLAQVVRLGEAEPAAGVPMERVSLGGEAPLGTLACASDRPDFPSEGERVVLQVAACKLTLVLHEARARSARQQSDARRERERVSRDAHLRELFSYVAHELNQPLAAVVTNANACTRWLAHTPANIDEASAAAGRIAGDARRASEVVSRVRGLFHAPAMQREVVSAADALGGIVSVLQTERATSALQLRVSAPPELAVLADRAQLEQVLLQLSSNACEAMAELPDGQRRLTLSAEVHGEQQVRFTVSDCGRGLSPARRERLFDLLLTSNPAGPGLGLRISRSLVQAHDGQLWVEQNPDGGESFHFTMPRSGAWVAPLTASTT